MDEDTIVDLKQFIAATVSQHTSQMRIEIVTELGARIDGVEARLDGVEMRLNGVEKKIDDLSTFVADALDASNEANATQLKDHEKRITRLEQHHA